MKYTPVSFCQRPGILSPEGPRVTSMAVKVRHRSPRQHILDVRAHGSRLYGDSPPDPSEVTVDTRVPPPYTLCSAHMPSSQGRMR